MSDQVIYCLWGLRPHSVEDVPELILHLLNFLLPVISMFPRRTSEIAFSPNAIILTFPFLGIIIVLISSRGRRWKSTMIGPSRRSAMLSPTYRLRYFVMSATLRVNHDNSVRDALWDSSGSVLGDMDMRCAAVDDPSYDASRSGAATLGAMEMGACASHGALWMGALASLVGAMMLGALASGARGMGASSALGALRTGAQVRWSYGVKRFFGSSTK